MKFKTNEIMIEFLDAPKLLKMLAYDVDNYVKSSFKKEITITRIKEKVDIEESGVHQRYLAFDVRDQHDGKRVFTDNEIKSIVNNFNGQYRRLDGHPTCIYHGGTAFHLHFQVPAETINLRGPIREKAS